MARTQSQKRRLLGFVKPSNSTSGLASSPGRSEARAGDLASVPAMLGVASPGMLARMKRFFNRSNQGSSTTIAAEIAGPGTSGGVQKEQGQSPAAPGLDAAATSSGGGAQAPVFLLVCSMILAPNDIDPMPTRPGALVDDFFGTRLCTVPGAKLDSSTGSITTPPPSLPTSSPLHS